jgi:hypothetical protein
LIKGRQSAVVDLEEAREMLLADILGQKSIDRQMGDGDKARSVAIASLRMRMDWGADR